MHGTRSRLYATASAASRACAAVALGNIIVTMGHKYTCHVPGVVDGREGCGGERGKGCLTLTMVCVEALWSVLRYTVKRCQYVGNIGHC